LIKLVLIVMNQFRQIRIKADYVLVHREMEKWQPCYSSQTGGLNHETET